MQADWELVFADGKVVCLCKAHYAAHTNKHLIDQVNKVKDNRACSKCPAEECITEGCVPFPPELYERITKLCEGVEVDLNAPFKGDAELD